MRVHSAFIRRRQTGLHQYTSLRLLRCDEAPRRLHLVDPRIYGQLTANHLNADKTACLAGNTLAAESIQGRRADFYTERHVTVQFAKVVNDFGVLLDSQLTMAYHIAAPSRSCLASATGLLAGLRNHRL